MPRGSIACWEGLNIPPAVPQGFVRHSDSTNRCSCLLLLLLWTFLFWVLEDFFFSPLNCKFFSSSRIVGPDCSRLSGVELTTIDYILIFWSPVHGLVFNSVLHVLLSNSRHPTAGEIVAVPWPLYHHDPFVCGLCNNCTTRVAYHSFSFQPFPSLVVSEFLWSLGELSLHFAVTVGKLLIRKKEETSKNYNHINKQTKKNFCVTHCQCVSPVLRKLV